MIISFLVNFVYPVNFSASLCHLIIPSAVFSPSKLAQSSGWLSRLGFDFHPRGAKAGGRFAPNISTGPQPAATATTIPERMTDGRTSPFRRPPREEALSKVTEDATTTVGGRGRDPHFAHCLPKKIAWESGGLLLKRAQKGPERLLVRLCLSKRRLSKI